MQCFHKVRIHFQIWFPTTATQNILKRLLVYFIQCILLFKKTIKQTQTYEYARSTYERN